MLVRLLDQIARRREHPTRRSLMAKCTSCGRPYQKAWGSHSPQCWWCQSFEDVNDDPYVDLGGGD